jgi:histidine triad (HIT) family protein
MAEEQQYTPEQIAEIKKKLASMKPEEVQELIKKQCVFCRVLKGEIPTYPIWEDDKVFVTLEIQPGNEGHVLVLPKEHYSVLPQMPDDIVAHLFSVAKQIASVIFDATGAEGVELRQRNGQAAGQMIPHVHVHVIPRFQKDGIVTDWKPKQFSEDDFKTTQKKLAGLAKSIKYSAPKTKIVEKIVHAPASQVSPGPVSKTKVKPKRKAPKKKDPRYRRKTP